MRLCRLWGLIMRNRKRLHEIVFPIVSPMQLLVILTLWDSTFPFWHPIQSNPLVCPWPWLRPRPWHATRKCQPSKVPASRLRGFGAGMDDVAGIQAAFICINPGCTQKISNAFSKIDIVWIGPLVLCATYRRFRLPVFRARASDYIERWCHASMGRRAIDLGSIQSPGSEGTALEIKKYGK